MKRLVYAALVVLVAMVGLSARAEVNVEGRGAQGLPGQRVFLEVLFDYGSDFKLIVEEINISFPSDVLAFVKDASTIDLFSQPRTFDQYKTFLGGGVLDNAGPDFYNFSFFTTTPQSRSGLATMRTAFDILPTALPGRYDVSISGALYDESECCDLPGALRNLNVTVVPEPQAATMLLVGLLVTGAAMRRRAKRARPK